MSLETQIEKWTLHELILMHCLFPQTIGSSICFICSRSARVRRPLSPANEGKHGGKAPACAVKKKNEPSIFHLFKFDQVKARVAGATQTLKCNFLVLSLLSVIIFNWALVSCDCKQVAAQGVPSFTFCPFDRLWAKSCLLGRFSVETGWTECPLVSLCWLPVSRFSPQTWCCGLSAGSGGAGSEGPYGLDDWVFSRKAQCKYALQALPQIPLFMDCSRYVSGTFLLVKCGSNH